MADHIKVFQGRYADGAVLLTGKIACKQGYSVLGSLVVESSFYHGVGVLLQRAVNGHPFEREVLLGEEVACEHEAGEEKGEVFFHRIRGNLIK